MHIAAKDVVVKSSRIQGKGVFAARDFKKGEVVFRWDTSSPMTAREAAAAPKDKKRFIVYYNATRRYYVLQPPACFVNHSCDANTRPLRLSDVAIKDIKKGDEITSDYIDEKTTERFACSCRSKNCRGHRQQP